MIRTGRLRWIRFSILLKRLVVWFVLSSPIKTQPKLESGLSIHNCTSATISGDAQIYGPRSLTSVLALAGSEKSPPAFSQVSVLKIRCTHVASPGVEAMPFPSFCSASEEPWPQSARSLWRDNVFADPAAVRDILSRRVTLLIVAPAGIFPAISNAITMRRILPPLFVPENKWPRGILKKCVTSQAVYPLSEQHGLKARERRYTAHEEGKHWE